MNGKSPSDGGGLFGCVIRAVNGNAAPDFQVTDYPENINYVIETITRPAPVTLTDVMPDNERPSPDGIAKIRSAKVGQPCWMMDHQNKIVITILEALYLKQCEAPKASEG